MTVVSRERRAVVPMILRMASLVESQVRAASAALVTHESLSVAASNDNFGDPAVNIDKKLRVDYTFDGAAKSKTVAEGQTLTISNTGQ